MKKFLYYILGAVGIIVVPSMALAQDLSQLNGTATQLQTFVTNLTGVVNLVIPFMIAIAVIAFIFFIIRYVIAGNDPDGKKTAKMGMMWSVIAIAVIVLLFGLVALLGSLFGIKAGGLTQSGLGSGPTV